MVSVSVETEEATDVRLRGVLAQSTLSLISGPYGFVESPVGEPLDVDSLALAIVRDDQVWSQLVPAMAGMAETLDLWRFHFPAGCDNSGFVGWLATHIKRRFGSGVVVICGYNSNSGGVFDYWGCPVGMGEDIANFIRELAS